jgi:hypothetical protein
VERAEVQVVTEACRKNGRKVFSWFSWRMEELRKTNEGGFTLIELLAVVLSSINSSAWKGYSANFALAAS